MPLVLPRARSLLRVPGWVVLAAGRRARGWGLMVKAPRAGYVEGLKVTAGQQVFDSSVLFTIKDNSAN